MIRSTGGRLIARPAYQPMAHRRTFWQRHTYAIIVTIGIVAGVILGWSTAAYGLGVR